MIMTTKELTEKVQLVLALLKEIQELEKNIRDSERIYLPDWKWTRKETFDYNKLKNNAFERRIALIKERDLDLTWLHLSSSWTCSWDGDWREIHIREWFNHDSSTLLYSFEQDRFVFTRVDEIFSFSRK